MDGRQLQLQVEGARVTRRVPREIITTENGYSGSAHSDNMGKPPSHRITATNYGIGESVPRLGDDTVNKNPHCCSRSEGSWMYVRRRVWVDQCSQVHLQADDLTATTSAVTRSARVVRDGQLGHGDLV
jgi:hypothetical protein